MGYMLAEILELAGNCARFFRKKRITPRCVQLSLLHDKELDQLTKGVIVPGGGVRPYIHPSCLETKMLPFLKWSKLIMKILRMEKVLCSLIHEKKLLIAEVNFKVVSFPNKKLHEFCENYCI